LGRKLPLFIYFIIGLAVIGLIASLIKNPGSFLMSILMMIAVAFVIFMIFSAILNRRSGGTSDEMKKYKKAAKQSNLKYNKQKPKIKKPVRTDSPLKSKRRKRHAPHLTVIEGKKSSNKNNNDRASN